MSAKDRLHRHIRSLCSGRQLFLAVLVPAVLAGCAVPQGPGKGKRLHLQEPESGRGCWLYLPKQYPADPAGTPSGKLWPLVVTLHGMKPFDSYGAQINEWQQQADAYGFVVCAPNLRTSDLMMEIPLRNVHPYVIQDERTVMAMMDQVFRTTDADPNNVLITSWSSGGYLAHYLLNRHPERFSCLAVRQSNFSASILRPEKVREYRGTPVAIFFGQNDFAICRTESREAVSWYRDRGFVVEAFSVEGLGHERTPETAANYFARVCGRSPVDRGLAQQALARVRIQPVMAATDEVPLSPAQSPDVQVSARSLALVQAGRDLPPARADRPASDPLKLTPALQPVSPQLAPVSAPAVRIRLSSPGGIAPVYLRFRLESVRPLPGSLDCLWLHNGEPVCSGLTGTRVLRTPGQHLIEALVTTPDGKQLRPRRAVVVQRKIPLSSSR